MMKNIILLGSGGHAKSVIDAIEKGGEYKIQGFLEIPEKQEFMYKDYRVIGIDNDMLEIRNSEVDYAFITLGFMGKGDIRERLYDKLIQNGYILPTIIDPSASVASDAEIEAGTFIGKNAIINSNSHIGKMCIINTGAVVEHDCKIGNYSHIAVGAVLCGGIEVGYSTLVGANATVIQGLTIGNNAIIGAGSVVLRDVDNKKTVVGNPAHNIKD